MKRVFNAVLLFLVVLSLGGCITATFNEPVASYEQSINKSSAIVGDYYAKFNDFERGVYFSECIFTPDKELLAYENGKPTPLLYKTLSPESIKARADALILIGIYSSRLLELARNDSPKVFKENSFNLGENLQDLSKTFAKLSKSDVTAMHYSAPISKIAGIVGEMYLRNSRDKIIELAVKRGYPAVNKVLEQLQGDLNGVILPLQKTGIRQRISEMIIYYNENRNKLTLSRRRTELGRIDDVIREYNCLINSNPANLVQEMKQANDALLKYAESSRTPKDLAVFMFVMERFARNVEIYEDSTR